MDVELLSKMLSELIADHDSVALPGLGMFVAVEMPASFSDRGFTVNPPYRKLSFMPGGADDGLLEQLYAKSNSIDIDSSKAILSHFFLEVKEVLKDTKNLVLPDFGRLKATKDNTFFFVPDENLDIYPEGFGLPAVSLKNTRAISLGELPSVSLKTPALAGPGETVPSDGPLTSEPKTGKFRWWIPAIAVIALAAVLMAVFLILVQVAPDFIDTLLYTPEELRIIHA